MRNAAEQYRVQKVSPEEVDAALIQQIADEFLLAFSQAPYGQYIFYPSVGEPISAEEVFQTPATGISARDLYSFNPHDYPCHPQTGEQAEFWIDREQAQKILRDKIRRDAHLALLRDREDGRVVGASLGIERTLQEVFESTEWQDPYLYSTVKKVSTFGDFADFYQRIRLLLSPERELRPSDRFFLMDLAFIAQEARQRGFFRELLQTTFSDIPEEQYDMPFLAEVKHNEVTHQLLDALGSEILPNYLGEGHHLMLMMKLGTMVEFFQQPKEQLRKLIGTAREKDRNTEDKIALSAVTKNTESLGYTPRIGDNPKVEVRDCKHDRGVFAKENIAQGEPIATFVGAVMKAKKLSDLNNDPPKCMRDHVVQVAEDEYIYGENGLAELVNHSCEPNCGMPNGITIVAMRDIKAGEQITWDYAMTEDSDWRMEGCQCGSGIERCRGVITAFRDLPPALQLEYWPYISPWLRAKYDKKMTEIMK